MWKGLAAVGGQLDAQLLAARVVAPAVGVVNLQHRACRALQAECRGNDAVHLSGAVVAKTVDVGCFFAVGRTAHLCRLPGDAVVGVEHLPENKVVFKSFVEEVLRAVVIHRDTLTAELRIRTGAVARGEFYGINAGKVVLHCGVLLCGESGGTAGKTPDPGIRVAGGSIYKGHHAARAHMRYRHLEDSRRRHGLGAAAIREAVAACRHRADVGIDSADGSGRPDAGTGDAGRHNGEGAGGVVVVRKVVPQFVRLQVAQEVGVARKSLQDVVAVGQAQGAQPCQAHHVAVEVAVGPQGGHVEAYAEAAAVAPVAERNEEVIGQGRGGPGVAGRAGRDEIGNDDEDNLVGKLVIVVGLHVIEHAEGKVLDGGHGAEKLE